MNPKNIRRWITLPFRVIRLVTPNRLGRLWYYIRLNQPAIILDRLKRLLELGSASHIQLHHYSPSDLPWPLEFPHCNAPLVSIIIPAHNQWETTRACLVSIRKNTSTIAYEVIIADDCSNDDTCRVSELAPGTRRVETPNNLGFLRNCNNAAKQARGEYLLLLNNDTQVQPGWLPPLVEVTKKNEHVGIVGSMLLYPDGSLQEAGGIIWQDGSGWNYGRFDYPERPEYNYLKEVDYVSGACILIRKSLWDDIGGFDEHFSPAYYEDTDLAFEARQRKYKVMYQPLSRVVHLEGISHGTDLNSGIKSYQSLHQITFREKWAATLDASHGRDLRDLSRARDRSLKKKRLLFIDHYVPLRDQDAGSRSTFQYLTLMAEMGYQITFLGDNFVDYQPYTTELQQLGIEVLYGSGLQRHWKRWLTANAKDFDYVYLSRPSITRKYLPHIRQHSSAKILYCGHDLHCLREERHYQVEGKHAHLQAAQKWAILEEGIMRQVDMSYFFSSFEVDEVRRRFPGISARAIPLYLFNDAEICSTSANGFTDRKGLLFVGGFMHAPNIDAVHWFSEEVLPQILKILPEIVFTVVGSNPPKDISRLASDRIHITGRISDEELLRQYNQTRLVVAPLRFGAGIKGKIVEAMRFGAPTVTTTVGAEGIGNTDSGLFITDDAAAFAKTVIRAYTCQETWEEATRRSQEAIRKYFSKEAARIILKEDMPL